jgi:hypothetical protein
VKEQTKRWWLGRHRGRRAVAWVIVVILLGLLIGFGFPALVDAAWSAETHPAVTASEEKEPVCGPGNEAECRKYVKAFKAGRAGRSHGLPVQKLFDRPKVARGVWVDKITVKLKKTCRQGMASQQAHGNAQVCRTADVRKCDRCLAYDLYRDMVQHATCSGRGDLDYINDHLCAARYPGSGPHLTKRQLQIGGTAVLCAGNVAIAARGGGGLLAGLFGSAACGWALWEAIDPG